MALRSLLTSSFSSLSRRTITAATTATATTATASSSSPPSILVEALLPADLAAAAAAAAGQRSRSDNQRQRRWYWQEVVRGTVDRGDGTNRYEDPDAAATRAARAQNAEGLLRRRGRYFRYEKPWMKKKRLKNQRTYRNQERGVEELKMYIQFQRDYKEAVEEAAAGGKK